MLTMLRRFFGCRATITESVPASATKFHLERACARVQVNQEANSSARLPKIEPEPLVDKSVDTLMPITEPEANSPANIWLEMRRKQGLAELRAHL
jgi:hypothetical protein